MPTVSYPRLSHSSCQPFNTSSGKEIDNRAPGENKHPASLMTDNLCDELAFPVLFPKARFNWHNNAE